MEPKTEKLVLEFVYTNDHLERIPGVDKDQEFDCAVCSGHGKYAVLYWDPIQSRYVRVGRDCDRYVRKVMNAHRAVQLQKRLSRQVSEILSV